MTPSLFTSTLLKTAQPAAVVVVRVVVVVGNAPQGLDQHTNPKPRRRKPGGVFRLGPSPEGWLRRKGLEHGKFGHNIY